VSEPRKALCSIGTGPQARLLRLARRSFEPYARRHGYELQLLTEPYEHTRPVPWSKVALIRDLLPRYDVILWLDADVVIVDPYEDIAARREPDRFLALVEHHYDGQRFPNTGVLLFGAGAEAAAFLDELWAADDYAEHRWWENAAVLDLLGYDVERPNPVRQSAWRDRTQFLPNEWNSTVHDPASHPRFRHYPGYSVARRSALMARDLVRSRATRRMG
jgi:glycosyl transferase family (putative galactosyltransferase)